MKSTDKYTQIQYQVSHATKILFIGANPSPGTYKRKIPFSSNKSFWYHLHAAGLVDESREELKVDALLKEVYEKKFTQVYQLGILNIANRPTKTFAEIKQAEAIPGIALIRATIKKYKPKVVCFIGKRTYQLFIKSKECDYGWQPDIGSSKIFVMHTPIHGLASTRVKELKKIGKVAGLLK